MTSSSRCKAAALLVAAGFLAGSCVGPESDSRLDRHATAEVWQGALAQQVERPQQWIPELALLVATPIARHEDHRWSDEMASDAAVTGGQASRGDAAAVGLALLAGGIAAGDWIGGDDGRSTEVLVESFVVTEGMTEIVKSVDRRGRPVGGKTSFPSGHTSFAFSMATFAARSCADAGDVWYRDLGYLAYVPAAYVGISRVEAQRHYPSDVLFGAFLGLTITNLFYDAHYGDAEHPGIFRREDATAWHFEPEVGLDGIAIAMVKRF